jgi:hypothetical protein
MLNINIPIEITMIELTNHLHFNMTSFLLPTAGSVPVIWVKIYLNAMYVSTHKQTKLLRL